MGRSDGYRRRLLIEGGVKGVEVLAVEFIGGKTEAFAEALIVYDFAGGET